MNFRSINKHPIWGLFLVIGLGLVPASIFIWPSEHGGGIEVGLAIFFAVIAAFIFINSILGFRRLRRGITDGDVQTSRSGFWKGFFSAIALVFLGLAISPILGFVLAYVTYTGLQKTVLSKIKGLNEVEKRETHEGYSKNPKLVKNQNLTLAIVEGTILIGLITAFLFLWNM